MNVHHQLINHMCVSIACNLGVEWGISMNSLTKVHEVGMNENYHEGQS